MWVLLTACRCDMTERRRAIATYFKQSYPSLGLFCSRVSPVSPFPLKAPHETEQLIHMVIHCSKLFQGHKRNSTFILTPQKNCPIGPNSPLYGCWLYQEVLGPLDPYVHRYLFCPQDTLILCDSSGHLFPFQRNSVSGTHPSVRSLLLLAQNIKPWKNVCVQVIHLVYKNDSNDLKIWGFLIVLSWLFPSKNKHKTNLRNISKARLHRPFREAPAAKSLYSISVWDDVRPVGSSLVFHHASWLKWPEHPALWACFWFSQVYPRVVIKILVNSIVSKDFYSGTFIKPCLPCRIRMVKVVFNPTCNFLVEQSVKCFPVSQIPTTKFNELRQLRGNAQHIQNK